MGNQICWCCGDQKEPDDNQVHQNLNTQNNAQNISMQDNKKSKLEMEKSQPLISQQSKCQFCTSYFQISGFSLKMRNINNKSHPIHQENFGEMHTQSDTLVQLNNDPISTIVSTWFQLAVALPKYVQNNDNYYGIINEMQLIEQQDQINDEDLQTLICLKWGVVDFFKLSQQIQPENDIIRECFQMFKRIAHYCIFFNELYLENYSQISQRQNISLYIQFYENYQRIMSGYTKMYENLIDEMQEIYQKQFEFKNENNQYPHFKVIGYMMRFWCQIMLNSEIQKKLEDSFRKLDKIKDQTLFYQYVIYALDVNINEDNVHWIGHRINFKYDKKLLIDQHWLKEEEQTSNSDSYIQIDQMLIKQKMLYPSWFYDLEIKYKGIQNKIKNIVSELKQTFLKSTSLYQSEENEFEGQTQSDSLNKNLCMDCFSSKESLQPQLDYLKQLLTTNVLIESCDSLDSTDTLDTIRQKLSTDSKMSTSDSIIVNKYNIQKLSELISDLIQIKKKLRQREFMLSQRAKKYKLGTDRNIEWLHFFEKTNFNKIPDSKNQLRRYILPILNKLMQKDDYYKIQKENSL